MLSVDSKYLELVKSNMRPKVEPVITVTGKDTDGTEINLTWNAGQIQKLSYKRGIDPVGREISYMELTWTEIYTGNLNSENYPEKYDNLVKYMAVDLTFVQDTTFAWQGNNEKISIKMPRMFLVSKPVIDGKTITWTARDLLYFLESSQIKSFPSNISYRNALRLILLDERANFRNSVELLNAIQKTQANLLIDNTETFLKNVSLDASAKQLLRGLANIKNYHWQFVDDYATLVKFSDLLDKTEWWPAPTVYDFTSKIMYEFPKLTMLPTMSAYSFKQYLCELDAVNQYTLSPYETIYWKDVPIYHYAFKGLGQYTDNTGTRLAKSTYSLNDSLVVIPATINSIDFYSELSQKGECFEENNSCNPYSLNAPDIVDRITYLKNYFKSGSYSAEINSLSNVAIEPGDLVSVETNLFDEDTRITKYALVLSIELEYTGALKQKTIVHTR